MKYHSHDHSDDDSGDDSGDHSDHHSDYDDCDDSDDDCDDSDDDCDDFNNCDEFDYNNGKDCEHFEHFEQVQSAHRKEHWAQRAGDLLSSASETSRSSRATWLWSWPFYKDDLQVFIRILILHDDDDTDLQVFH